jgi:hypothetical protein
VPFRPRRLGGGGIRGHLRAMSRLALAVPLGLFGFLAYVAAAVALADHVLGRHWALEVAYFALAGFAWVIPARRLILWAARER